MKSKKSSTETRISVVINTLNEASNIEACIQSVKEFGDEILVCDMYSDDDTVSIAKKLGARIVYHQRTNGFVEPARYEAIKQARYEWVLVIDADERLTSELSKKLQSIVHSDHIDMVIMGILFNYFGKFIRHGGFYGVAYPRFFRKHVYLNSYSNTDEIVHENFRALERASVRKMILPPDLYLIHWAYPTVESYFRKTICFYARIEAIQRYRRGERFSLIKLLYEPLKEVAARLIYRAGFLDGIHGIALVFFFALYRMNTWLILLWLQLGFTITPGSCRNG